METVYGAACYIPGYPRPQFVRNEWEELNGEWNFCFDDKWEGEKNWSEQGLPVEKVRKIQVPFTYETKASGIGDETVHDCVWYERIFRITDQKDAHKRLLLHFEGSDFETTVWVNGKEVGNHKGGYERFSFDITEQSVNGENRLSVCVKDSLDRKQPRGKQRWMKENYACWYVQTTGIWKTVWLEWVPEIYLERVKMTPDLQRDSVEAEVFLNCDHDKQHLKDVAIVTTVYYHGTLIAEEKMYMEEKHVSVRIPLNKPTLTDQWGVHLWSPDTPNLYDIEFRLIRKEKEIDRVGSYFGMRSIEIKDSQILLNGIPLYQKLILDQGYWSESHLTPPSEQALIDDIDHIHELGYNGLRKHQKIEDERFLYWCDVKGMLVWSEMAAAYRYSDSAVEQFTREWVEIVRQNYNHPSIVTWVPINESWGVPKIRKDIVQQHFTEAVYYLTKSLDWMRPVVVNDGWEHTVSDLLTLHDYEASGEKLKEKYRNNKEEILNGKIPHCGDRFALAEGFSYRGQPVLISEYGGIAFANEQAGWGYGDKVNDQKTFVERFDSVTTAIKSLPYVCGYCYTQVSDVQQEINGLMTEDRLFKVAPEVIREINEKQVL